MVARLGLLLALVVWSARADERSAAKVAEALGAFDAVDAIPRDDKSARLAQYERVVTIAEEAVALDDRDAHAHFALFLGLAGQMEIAGLSWRSLTRLHRMVVENDRAYALAPDDADILVARSQLLRELPRPLGGDPGTATALLARALALNPNHVAGRLYLAEEAAASGAPDARMRAEEALALATRAHARRQEAEARALVANLEDGR